MGGFFLPWDSYGVRQKNLFITTSGCFRLFAWFVNCTSLSLSEDDDCGIDLWILAYFLNWLKQLNFSKENS